MYSPDTKHLVIVDGHHLMYRAYWAIPRTMKTAKGEQVNTPFGVASMLLMILKTEQPTHLLFCFDADEDTFRHEEYQEYKAGRAETPDDFFIQIPRTLSLIDRFGIKSVSGGKYEADDFACTYARMAEREGYKVTVVSGDRDLFQLCSENIRVAIPHKGYQAAEYLGPHEVKAKYGITPEQVPSYKGLVGDSSDNLPGVKGIGPKAAEVLLQQYPDITTLYEHLSTVKESWRLKLEADREQAFFCERLARLKSDIVPPVALDDLAFTDIQTAPILDLFSELNFLLVNRRFLSLLDSAYGRAHFMIDSALEATFLLAEQSSASQKVRTQTVSESPQLSLL
jgi:DNA polymerase-1